MVIMLEIRALRSLVIDKAQGFYCLWYSITGIREKILRMDYFC